MTEHQEDTGVRDPMPIFVLKAKDNLAPRAIDNYAEQCRKAGLDEQAAEVAKAAAEVRGWRRRHPERCKLPDHKHLAATSALLSGGGEPLTRAVCAECGARVEHRLGAWHCPTHHDRATVRFEPLAPAPSGETGGGRVEDVVLTGEDIAELVARVPAGRSRLGQSIVDLVGDADPLQVELVLRTPPASSEGEQDGRAREWWIARKAGYDGPAAWIVVANDGEASKLRDEWPDDIEVVRVREIPASPSTEGGEDG